MYLEKHLGSEVKARLLEGGVVRGELVDLQPATKPDTAYILEPGKTDATPVPFNTISTAGVVGDFGGE